MPRRAPRTTTSRARPRPPLPTLPGALEGGKGEAERQGRQPGERVSAHPVSRMRFRASPRGHPLPSCYGFSPRSPVDQPLPAPTAADARRDRAGIHAALPASAPLLGSLDNKQLAAAALSKRAPRRPAHPRSAPDALGCSSDPARCRRSPSRSFSKHGLLRLRRPVSTPPTPFTVKNTSIHAAPISSPTPHEILCWTSLAAASL